MSDGASLAPTNVIETIPYFASQSKAENDPKYRLR